jgi:FtsH-binding integral membrane protein
MAMTAIVIRDASRRVCHECNQTSPSLVFLTMWWFGCVSHALQVYRWWWSAAYVVACQHRHFYALLSRAIDLEISNQTICTGSLSTPNNWDFTLSTLLFNFKTIIQSAPKLLRRIETLFKTCEQNYRQQYQQTWRPISRTQVAAVRHINRCHPNTVSSCPMFKALNFNFIQCANGINNTQTHNNQSPCSIPLPASIYMGAPSRSLFNSKQIRAAFVSKVFSILAVQLVIATAIIAWFTLHQPTKEYFRTGGFLWFYLASVAGLVVFFVIACVESARRSYPCNLILLMLLTLAYGMVAGILSAQYNTVAVLCAFGATAFATFVIILLAKFSPFDLTTHGCALCVLALIHSLVTIILIIVLVPAHANMAQMIIAGTGAFLVSLYLMFDLQLIMGGRTFELSPEEYVLAATLLYIDIINLFQYLLILMGGRD